MDDNLADVERAIKHLELILPKLTAGPSPFGSTSGVAAAIYALRRVKNRLAEDKSRQDAELDAMAKEYGGTDANPNA